MATIVNTPAGGSDNSGVGLIVGLLLAAVLVILFVVYGLPYIRSQQQPTAQQPTTNIQVTLPTPAPAPAPAPTPAPAPKP